MSAAPPPPTPGPPGAHIVAPNHLRYKSASAKRKTLDFCDFCVEFVPDSPRSADLLYPRSLPSRLLFSTAYFNVFPCLGSIERGHLLIASAHHCTSTVQVPGAGHDDYPLVVTRVVEAVRRRFNKTPAFFEHGDPTGLCELQGPCVAHAHVHVAPSGQGILSKLKAAHRLLASAPLTDLSVEVREPYLMCSDENLVAHYFADEGTPRQYLRQLYAECLGAPDAWNWAASFDLDQTSCEAQILRECF